MAQHGLKSEAQNQIPILAMYSMTDREVPNATALIPQPSSSFPRMKLKIISKKGKVQIKIK